jgi:tripartite-type tricarboxylate transporter receptor subunit TctC
MMTKTIWGGALICAVAGVLTAPGPAARADDYPTHPIRMICPQAAGGPTDFLSRVVADKLSQEFGQQVIVDNRPGASTMIGAELVARAKPDGYTLLMATVTTFALNPSLFAKMPYDPLKDFAPVSLVARTPFFMIVNKDLPVKNVQDLIALAKAKPGTLNYGSPGTGTSPHLVGALFAKMAGIDIRHVPYKAQAAAAVDLESGLIQLSFDGGGLSRIQNGQVRGLGVTTLRRSAIAPDIPTMDEQGLSGFEASLWTGIAAPTGTPGELVARLQAAIAKAMKAPDARQRIESAGGEPVGSTPAEFAALIKSDQVKWGQVVRDSGVQIEQ